MTELCDLKCVPCRGGVPPLAVEEIDRLKTQLEGWEVIDGHHLHKHLSFPDFAASLAYVNQVGALAEEEGHHPDVHLSWGAVGIDLWTHKIDGLTESDFILAAKIDRLR